MMIKANVHKKFLSLFTISRHFYCRTMVCFPLNTFLLKIMTMSYRATGRAENCSSPNPCFSPPEFTGTGLRYEKHGINITCREKCSALSGMPIITSILYKGTYLTCPRVGLENPVIFTRFSEKTACRYVPKDSSKA